MNSHYPLLSPEGAILIKGWISVLEGLMRQEAFSEGEALQAIHELVAIEEHALEWDVVTEELHVLLVQALEWIIPRLPLAYRLLLSPLDNVIKEVNELQSIHTLTQLNLFIERNRLPIRTSALSLQALFNARIRDLSANGEHEEGTR